MKIANITPTTLLEIVLDDQEKYHFVLANQVLNNQKYADFYRSRVDSFITLDLGSCVIDLQLAQEAIHQVLPDELCLPDFRLYPLVERTHLTKRMIRILRKFGIPFMVRPFGETMDEFMESILQLSKLKQVTTIGLPLVISNISRSELIGMFITMYPKLKFHFFDCQDNLEDLKSNFNCRSIRSLSTKKIIQHGLEGSYVNSSNFAPRLTGGSLPYFERTAIPEQIHTIRKNIEYWRNYCEMKK